MRALSISILGAALALTTTACGSSDTTAAAAATMGAGGAAASAAHGGAGQGGAGPTGGAGQGGAGQAGGGQGGGAGGPIPASVMSTSGQTALESETSVAVGPDDVVAVAWIGLQPGGQSTNGYRFSADGGRTWGAVSSLDSPGARVASDPVLAFDAKGATWMSWVGYHVDQQGGPFDMHVYAASAPAGTTAFGAPIDVSEPGGAPQYDKPWITVTSKGTVLVTYAKTSTGGIFVSRSTDGGATWTRSMIVEDGGFRNLVYPCTTSSRVYVTYHAGGGIGLRWSDDDGATWPDANKTAVAEQGEQPAFDDPTCVAEGDEIWIAYGLSNDPFSEATAAKLSSIRLAHSADGGKTIDRRSEAKDAAAAPFAMHPALAREDGGALDLVYYAGAKDGDTAGSYRLARSTDGGETWAPSAVLAAPITFLQARGDKKWLGDYTGVAWKGGALYTSFADNSGEASHVAFARAVSP
jgi:hypothetical protein